MTQVGRTKYVTPKKLVLWVSSFPLGNNHHVCNILLITAYQRSCGNVKFSGRVCLSVRGGRVQCDHNTLNLTPPPTQDLTGTAPLLVIPDPGANIW